MKVIYLHQYFKTPSENGGTRSYDLAKSFVQSGYYVYMVTTTSNEKYKNTRWKVEMCDGIEVHYLYLPYDNSMSYFERCIAFLKFMILASVRLLKIKGDLLLATSTPLTIGIPALLKKTLHKTPLVFEVRDVWPEAVIAVGAVKNRLVQKVLYLLEKLIYNKSDIIVPLSVDMKKSITARYPYLERKIPFVVENIAEVNRFSMTEKINLKEWLGVEPRFSILYAGTFGKVNNIHYVIELASRVIQLDSSICFILMGSGSEKNEIIEIAKKRGLFNKNVFFPDPVSKRDLDKIYSSVSMGSSFVAPIQELWANSANKFFDTLAAGKPVLINHYGWQADVIENRNIGYVLPPSLDDKAVSKFVEYSKDINLHREQEQNSRTVAISEYSLEVASSKYLKIFNKIHV
ncbi:glycosyltransferase family 4 protein [Sphingobacterium thermophilum]|uniref:Glycosyltransferase family 4 protein n=1 Tax=Sphingobacterium thermophilum TaxID=768534 RepID=A0ABP8R0D8_9SPHI